MLPAPHRRTVVVGAGIVGVATAIWLLRRGHPVAIVDAGSERSRASYGNAGVLAACSVVPVTVPGLVARAPRLVLDRDSPLFLRWGYLPRLAPWLLRYLGHCNEADVARIARGLAPLLADTLAQHRALAAGTPAERLLQGSGYLFAYPSRAAFAAEALVWRLRAEAGFSWQEIAGPELRSLDPALGPGIGFGVLLGEHGFVLDPGAYLAALGEHARALGAERRRAAAIGFRLGADGSFQAVVTDRGEVEGARAVVATGAWSKALAAELGLSVPLESERGYHVMLRDPSLVPRLPTMVASGRFVASPMAGGIRCAGIVEFGGLKAPAGRRPVALILEKVREAYPGLAFSGHEEWLGHRPAPSDSLPLVGEVPGRPGIFLAFGHHHVGLTAGPKTGRALAALIDGDDPGLDLAPYRPDRFARRRR
ncbi:MAG TPA: FAD-binding oxidoreductase [Microvirga sp.]|nr:FAD-binding oxidoreductase [Microvirga sp.]